MKIRNEIRIEMQQEMRISPLISSSLEEAASKTGKRKNEKIKRENFDALLEYVESGESKDKDYPCIIEEMRARGYKVSSREIDFVYSFLSI